MPTSGTGELVGGQGPARGAGAGIEAGAHGREEADVCAGTRLARVITCEREQVERARPGRLDMTNETLQHKQPE